MENRIILDFTEQQAGFIKQLAAAGIYGSTDKDVVEHLIAEGISSHLKAGTFSMLRMESKAKFRELAMGNNLDIQLNMRREIK